MEKNEPQLSLEDLAWLIGGDIGDELQERLIDMLRRDPRFSEQFVTLEGLAAEAGTEDVLQGWIRHQEFECLLAAENDWENPAEVLEPDRLGLHRTDYRQLLAIAESRLRSAEDPRPIQALKERLLQAEKEPARHAVFAVAEALEYLSERTADWVVREVRKTYWPGSMAG